MRSWLGSLTTRGTGFLAAGAAATLFGLVLGERALLSVGVLLLLLPTFSAVAASRARYRLSCIRTVTPARVPVGQPARVTLRLENISRFPTGLLLAEDTVPYTLGTRARYVLDGVERGGVRELSYPLRSDLRGKYVIGPLEIRIADVFGLVELGRSFTATTPLIVTPKVVPLARTIMAGSWVGEGDGQSRATAAAGEDDVIPRAYRDGDELRRVHWRSTARYGELMVRREEQRWRNRVVLLLDTRRGAYAGSGPASSFEYAVSAAASVGVHLAREGLTGELITAEGAIAAAGMFEDVLLDSLAVMKPSNFRDLSRGITALRDAGPALAVVIAGELTADQARVLAASRHGGGPAIALLLATSSWVSADPAAAPGRPSARALADGNGDGRCRAAGLPDGLANAAGHAARASAAATVLRGAGWRVAVITGGTPLEAAWLGLGAFTGAPGPRPAVVDGKRVQA
jgi:uncharacterized protein (DUF58 family)